MLRDCFTKMMEKMNSDNEIATLTLSVVDEPDADSGTVVSTPVIEPAISEPFADFIDPLSTTNTNGMQPASTVSSITILSSFAAAENTNLNTDKYVYNVPDGLEKNPELLRAEMLFYNTPETEAIAEDVYSALTNVQEQCEIDFQKYCQADISVSSAQFVDLHDVASAMIPTFTMFMLGSQRRRQLTASSGKALINSFRSYYLPQSLTSNAILAPLTEDVKKEVVHEAKNAVGISTGLVAQQVDSKNTVETMKAPISARSNVMINGRLSKEGGRRFADGHLMPKRVLHTDIEGHDHRDHEHGDRRPGDDRKPPPPPPRRAPANSNSPDQKYPDDPRGPPIGPGGKKPIDGSGPAVPPRGKYPPPPPPPFPGHESDSDSEDDEDEEFDEPPRSRRHHHGPPPNPWEDRFFPGALGYGAGGDMCMYNNIESLSNECLQAVGNVHALREQYWNQHVASTVHHHPHHIVLGFFAILGVVFLVKKCCFWKRRKQMKDLLVGLNADPELKATVENRLGVTVPEACKCPHQGSRQSCFGRLLTFLGVLVFSLISSLFITITSLEMTASIVHNMDENNPNGETTSPATALTILFLICTGQVALLSLVVYKIKKCYHRNQERFAPSAPAPSVVSGGNYRGDDGTAAGIRFVPVQFKNWVAPRISAMSSAISSFSRRITAPATTPSGYAPLLGDETEMISVGSTHGNPNVSGPRYAVYTGVPVNSNVNTTVVPIQAIQATPVTAVHFV